MAKRNNKKFDEEKEFEDIIAYRKDDEIMAVKQIVSKIIPKELIIKAKNEYQKNLINSIRQNHVTICSAPPGVGKTYIGVGMALSLLRKQLSKIKRIYLVKSITTLKGEDLGALKGDMREKFGPFVWSYEINMEKFIGDSNISKLYEEDVLRPFPLAYIKGASIDNAIILADESQNITMGNVRTLMTRLGKDSKLILMGDVNQVDIKDGNESCLQHIVKMFKDVPGFGVVDIANDDLSEEDYVRHPLIKVMEEKFNEFNEENGK